MWKGTIKSLGGSREKWDLGAQNGGRKPERRLPGENRLPGEAKIGHGQYRVEKDHLPPGGACSSKTQSQLLILPATTRP